jgi:RNA polymerase sigma-70 factor (ECF subfamily)
MAQTERKDAPPAPGAEAKPARPSDAEVEENIRTTYARTRKSLIERLHNWEDQKSWDEFYKTYWKLIYSVALKSGLRSEEAFDVVQETIVSIAKQSKEHKYDPNAGSFKSWLMNMTRWRIADQLRKRAKDTAMVNPYGNDEEERTHALDRVSDPAADQLERIWDNEWQSNLADRAVEIVKAKVSPKQFQIFDAYVIKGWEAKKVTRILGVSMAQVYLAKHRIGGLIKKEIAGLENQLI